MRRLVYPTFPALRAQDVAAGVAAAAAGQSLAAVAAAAEGGAEAVQIPQVEEGAGDAAAFGKGASQLAIAQLLLLHGFAGVCKNTNNRQPSANLI